MSRGADLQCGWCGRVYLHRCGERKTALAGGPVWPLAVRRFAWFLAGAVVTALAIGAVEWFDSRRDAAMINDLTDAYHECRDMLTDCGGAR